jgi:hypothetical protein
MTTTPSTGTTSASPPPPCIRRGAQWLSEGDLQAHLATMLRLENVGILLGAGTSMGALGGRSLAALWKEFEASYSTSAKWLKAEGFVDGKSAPNVEVLADTLEIARLEWKRAKDARLAALEKARGDLQRSVIDAAVLKVDWWKTAQLVTIETSELSAHRALLQKLTGARQPGQASPWIFTTNYDLAVEWAAESCGLKYVNGFDGLHRRSFSPHNFDLGWRNILARGEARFGTYHFYLAKLHGSLTWHEDSESVLESAASARWAMYESFLKSSSPTSLDGLVVLPSVTKYDRTIGFVLGELFRRFAEFLARPQTCLITNGYSFSDEHVNRLLFTALQNPTLQLVMYLPEAERKLDILDGTACAPWAKKVLAFESPRVTVVGGRPRGFFDALSTDLPDPAIYDEQAAKIREMLRDIKGGSRP